MMARRPGGRIARQPPGAAREEMTSSVTRRSSRRRRRFSARPRPRGGSGGPLVPAPMACALVGASASSPRALSGLAPRLGRAFGGPPGLAPARPPSRLPEDRFAHFLPGASGRRAARTSSVGAEVDVVVKTRPAYVLAGSCPPLRTVPLAQHHPQGTPVERRMRPSSDRPAEPCGARAARRPRRTPSSWHAAAQRSARARPST